MNDIDWNKLFAAVCLNLSISPQDFWCLTLPELYVLCSHITKPETISAEEIARLKQLFPD